MSLPGAQWAPYGQQEVASGRLDAIEYRTAHPDPVSELDDETTTARAARCDAAVTTLRERLERMQPDVLVVVGDDQKELFRDDGIPVFAVFCGEEIFDLPPGPEAYPSGMIAAYSAYHAAGPERYEVPSELGNHVVAALIDERFDVTISSRQPEGRGLGHAFTFVHLRLTPTAAVPMLPVMINTYFPPNQPSPSRCIEFGHVLRRAIEGAAGDARVVLVASGGLSHPVVDEELDRAVLEALVAGDLDSMAKLPTETLDHGNSEIRNWIAVGAALADASFEVVDYVPGYRSVQGSGCGMGFGVWVMDEPGGAAPVT